MSEAEDEVADSPGELEGEDEGPLEVGDGDSPGVLETVDSGGNVDWLELGPMKLLVGELDIRAREDDVDEGNTSEDVMDVEDVESGEKLGGGVGDGEDVEDGKETLLEDKPVTEV